MNIVTLCDIYCKTANDVTDPYQYLDSGLYVHFTETPQHFGINPGRHKSISLTGGPNGVYAYEWTKDMLNGKMTVFTHRPFLVLFRPLHPDKILDIATYSEQQLKTDLEKLRSHVEPLLIDTAIKRLDKYLGKFDIFRKTLSNAFGTPGGKLYYVISKLIEHELIDPEAPIPYDTPGVVSTSYANKIFKLLGYTGFTDRYGVLHTSEPNQTVFFDPSQLQVIGTFNNPLAR